MTLDQQLVQRFEPICQRIYAEVVGDMDSMAKWISAEERKAFDKLSKTGLMECLLDGGRLNPDEEMVLRQAIDEHGWTKVLRFLAKRVRL